MSTLANIRRRASGLASAFVIYPVAEMLERRDVRSKVAELRGFYAKTPATRRKISIKRLVDMLEFAGANVPYYRGLFSDLGFEPEKVGRDVRRLEQLPVLNKDIILEQGDRLYSAPLSQTRHYGCKTGGSTGQKIVAQYDQMAVDFSSAVTAFCRESIGATRAQAALHYAADLPGIMSWRDRGREWFKCLAMNRSNVLFGALDGHSLDAIWHSIQHRRPYLVHGHPSTMYFLANYLKDKQLDVEALKGVFSVFESSGELLDKKQRALIAEVFGCAVVDRYGLAEFGVLGYQFASGGGEMELLESECWAESVPSGNAPAARLIVTGFRNRLMPLIRYDTGDLAKIVSVPNGKVMRQMQGRIHDVICINDVPYLTHHVQDILDHHVSGVRDFQIDTRFDPPVLRIVPETDAVTSQMEASIRKVWADGFQVEFVEPTDMIRVGDRAKFRHVVFK